MSLDAGAGADAPGRLLAGRYRLVAPIGRGGMGAVWRAVDEVLGRDVAVKAMILPLTLPDEERATLRERALREARIAARLHHPSLVTVHDVVTEQDNPHIVMELVRSRSLQEAVATDGALAPSEVARIGLTLVDALRTAHAAGVLHRDVKPSNVLLGDDGRVVLTDFGVARLEGDPKLTLTGQLMGSPGYVAPEVTQGVSAATPASDLWSLGATLYTAVEGRQAYDRDSFFAVLSATANEEPDPVRLAGPLAPVLAGLLCRVPAERLDATRAERMLREVVRATAEPRTMVSTPPGGTVTRQRAGAAPLPADPAGAGRTAQPSTSYRSGGRRRRTVLAVAGALALVLALLAAVVAGPVLSWLSAAGDPVPETGGAAGSAVLPPGGTAAQPPGGADKWVEHADPGLGYALRVPRTWEEWRERREDNFLLLTRPGREPAADLLVARNKAFAGGSLANLKLIDQEFGAQQRANRYRRVRMETVPAPRGEDWADLEFTVLRPGSGAALWRVVDRNITTPAGVSYAVRIRVPEDEWPRFEREVGYALDTFRSRVG